MGVLSLIKLSRSIRRVAVAAAGAAVVSAALPALATAACPTTATTQPFERWGDTAAYTLVKNGHFESGTSGWSLTKAAVASGNESFQVRSATDSKSLAIQSTGTAVSPAFCVGVEHPSFRFFARRTSGSWGVLYVKLRWTDSTGRTSETVVGALDSTFGTAWAPSRSFALATALGLWQPGQSLSVRLVFDLEDAGGAWAIDDVYYDPYRR
jgi:hypothetical protein